MKTDLASCDFETLLALEDQMPRERFEQIKRERPEFARWLDDHRGVFCSPDGQERREIPDRAAVAGLTADPNATEENGPTVRTIAVGPGPE